MHLTHVRKELHIRQDPHSLEKHSVDSSKDLCLQLAAAGEYAEMGHSVLTSTSRGSGNFSYATKSILLFS